MARHHMEERIIHEFRVLQKHGGLAHVVQHQRGNADREPGDRDGNAAEVAHIGIKCFGAGDRVDDGAQGEEREQRVGHEEAHHPDGIERAKHFGCLDDVADPHGGDRDEVDQHDRAEQAADLFGPAALDRKEGDEDGQRDPHDPWAEGGTDDAEALDRGDDGDRRGEHGIGKEQRGGEERAR